MARLKFVVFAVLAIGLWSLHLSRVSSLALGASQEQAQSAIAGATAPVAVALEGRRSAVQAAALRLGASPAALNAGPKSGGKPEAPSVDRFAAVRSAVTEGLDASLKDSLFVAVQNDVGVLLARGTGEPAAAAPEGLDLAGVGQAGAAGALRNVEGAPYFVLAVPMFISDKNEVKASGFAVLGLPLLPDVKELEQVKKALALEGLGLVSQGKVVAAAGDKGPLEAQLGKLKVGSTQPTGSGPVRGVGPLDLPLMVDNPVHGLVGLQAIAGTGFEVVASASSKASLDALADYQVFAFGGLAALVLLALVVVVLIGGGEEQGAAMVMPPPVQVPQMVAQQARRDDPMAPAPLSMPEPEPAPEASPDDFDFPASSPSSAAMQSSPSAFPVSSPSSFPPPPVATGQNAAYEPEPMSDPFAQAAPPPAPPPPPVATSEQPAFVPGGLNDDMDEGQRTVNYPLYKGAPAGAPPSAADPFAMAAAQMGDEGLVGGEDNPESTRVAAVPQELIRAARAGGTGATAERPALKTGNIPKIGSVPPAGSASEEERHFQEVFRDFVATREKCGEPADGLTFDKFRTKLLKNKEQLVAKYACKTVRFQVYVKDGKAALKATPVKD